MWAKGSIIFAFFLSRIELTEYFPKGLSLDGGYKEPDVGRLLAWTHSGPWSGGILLLDVGESKVVKLPYEQFFNCELPGGEML